MTVSFPPPSPSALAQARWEDISPYFDELANGQVFDSAPSVTLTSGAAAMHQAILGDRLAISTDHELGRRVSGRGPLAHPAHVWDVSIGQSTLATIGKTEISIEQFRQLYTEKLQQLGARVIACSDSGGVVHDAEGDVAGRYPRPVARREKVEPAKAQHGARLCRQEAPPLVGRLRVGRQCLPDLRDACDRSRGARVEGDRRDQHHAGDRHAQVMLHPRHQPAPGSTKRLGNIA